MKTKSWLGMAVLGSLAIATAAFALAAPQTQWRKRAPDAPPELVGGPWLNTNDGAPISLQSRLGKPTLVAFWTFACSNCQANMPVYARILAKYRPRGVEMIAIHTPELRIERDIEQVKAHTRKFGIDYPILVDRDHENWDRWNIRCWPTLLVLDSDGRVVKYWEGELNWQGANGEKQVGDLLDRLLATKS